MKISFNLTDADLKYFRRVMKEVREKSRNKHEDEIVAAVRGLLQQIDGTSVPDFVAERIAKLEQLTDMLEDDEWALSGRDRERVVRSMAYFAEPEDIIPDRVPVLGLLDDAIMVELVVGDLIFEIEAYEDFCRFRETREERFGSDEDHATRGEWVIARRKQLHARIRRRRSRRRQQSRGTGGSRVSLW